jgi:hypothetical protein
MEKTNFEKAFDVRKQVIAQIAEDYLLLDTLETQNSGSDFKEQAVWCVKQALEDAYQAGLEAGRN